MSENINIVAVTGYLTRDSELTATKDGTACLRFALAVNASRPKGDSGREDYPNFIECTLFGKRAEGLAPYLKRGRKIGLSGRLRFSQWVSEDGRRMSRVGILADRIDFMSSNRDSGASQPAQAAQPVPAAQSAPIEPAAQPEPAPAVEFGMYDQDIPF